MNYKYDQGMSDGKSILLFLAEIVVLIGFSLLIILPLMWLFA